MKKVSTAEDIEKLLKGSDEIENVVRYTYSHEGFERLINFTVRGVKYTIEWYKNESKLWIGNVAVRFHEVEYSGTWPNTFKNNLQFYLDEQIVSILPVEQYQNKKKAGLTADPNT